MVGRNMMRFSVRKTLVFLLFYQVCCTVLAQTPQVCGYVLDNSTLEPLIGASVVVSGKGVATDKNGFFSLDVKTNKVVQLQCSYVGYKAKTIDLKHIGGEPINICLEPGLSIENITVKALVNKRADVVKVPMSTIKSIPNITGEPDLLKALHAMPGIQMGREGTSDLYVRGGEKDENLYLLDDVPLYYVNHIGGFMSVFDANIIKDVTVYKGVVPARYGGRLSSAIDVRLKDGNAYQRNGEFVMGTLASKIYLEGPLKKNSLKTKYLVSLRRCNLDLLMRPWTWLTSNGNDMDGYSFYDGTIKLTHTYNPKNKVTALVYFGRDKLFFNQKVSDSEDSGPKSKSKQKTNWGNRVLSVKWNHLIGSNMFNELRFSMNRFFNVNKNTVKYGGFDEKTVFRSSINDYSVQNLVKIINSNNKLYLGTGITMHHFKPTVSETATSGIEDYKDDFKVHTWASELFAFSDFEWNISSRFSFEPSLLFTYWAYANTCSVDPKVSLNYLLSSELRFNLGASLNHQYVHLLSSTTSGTPTELWIPGSDDLPAKTAKQLSAGFVYEKEKYLFSVEGYLKRWNGLITYNPSLSIKEVANWDQMVEPGGKGEMQGVEVFVSKKTGKINGSISYTLSKNMRSFETINNGSYFPFKYDRRHELNVLANINFSNNKKISFNWVFNSGSPVTVPEQWYPAIDNFDNKVSFTEAHYYGTLNNYRAEPYHRLDIGYSRTKKVGKTERTLYLGIYNVYNNLNPFYLYLEEKDNKMKLYKYTLFPMIPSISYSVKF